MRRLNSSFGRLDTTPVSYASSFQRTPHPVLRHEIVSLNRSRDDAVANVLPSMPIPNHTRMHV